jgi:CRISPR-associated protein Csh1
VRDFVWPSVSTEKKEVKKMIKDLTSGFYKARQRHSSIVLDNYKLKDGLYIRLYPDRSWEEQSADFDRNHLIVNPKEEESQKVELLKWIKHRDYHSSLIDMNKPVDPKKQVHSNNPYSLFVKREVFLGEKKDAKSGMEENIDRYLQSGQPDQVKLRWLELMPSSGKKGVAGWPEVTNFFSKSEYAEALAYLDSPERTIWADRIAAWYRSYYKSLTDFVGRLTFKNYVKLFFAVEPLTTLESPSCKQMYAFEYTLYTIPKIYNSNDYNQIVSEELVGLPSFDMTMNSKKPFLEHKTMRVQAPDRVPLSQALLAKEATEWLAAQPKYTTNKIAYESGFNLPAGSSPEGALHIYMDGKDNELHGFENVPFPTTVQIDLEWHNILQLKVRGEHKFYDPIQNVEMLQKAISSYYFRGRLNGHFLMDKPDVKSKDFTAVMVALFLQSRQGFHDWFYKGTILSIRGIFAAVTLRLLEEQLLYVEHMRFDDLADAYNLRISIEMVLNEKGGAHMADRIGILVNSLREKLSQDGIVTCSSDEEFYFITGQLVYYLTKQSEAQKITGDMYEPFLRTRNGQQIKRRLEHTYMMYKHKILSGYGKFNKAFSMVMGYEPKQGNEGRARDLLLAGLFAHNLLFEKSE